MGGILSPEFEDQRRFLVQLYACWSRHPSEVAQVVEHDRQLKAVTFVDLPKLLDLHVAGSTRQIHAGILFPLLDLVLVLDVLPFFVSIW